MTSDVLKRVAALPEKSTDELKEMWQNLCKSSAPPYNRTYLIRGLAYRIQELAWGGLSETTKAKLEALAAEEKTMDRTPNPIRNDGLPVAGTRLVREWKGVEHSCTVLDDGFEYQGRKFKSLSAAARAVTGTRWNGKIFWLGGKK
ncbi:conserved hypothetical protein [Magnetococcus marinus MC-1]|uniref:Bacteriophage-related protein n=1 Tax=Magnetococcus marinus (strain ATCC BAA-1437 / JCM 17883 / MC-1) TaxID=156889 RepID=A0LB20_MAGMM|nr:DUF2924 domain-containing protein [Magnetococcus marinus]ABK45163.1 conserved hypothetical protein [Magnetococcus marinus MC-1]